MSGPTVVPYRVTYSERVRQRIRALAKIAFGRGEGEAYLAAVAEFHQRLTIYPQFGEPLIDLIQQSGQIWIATIPPVTMRYAVFDELRVVAIATLPVLSPKARPRSDESPTPT